MKQNQMLAKIEAKYRLQYQRKFDTMMQMFQDAAMIAAHEVCGLGPRNAVEFAARFREIINEMAKITVEDAKDDPECWYTKEKVDEVLRGICGESFQAWEERYN